MSWIRTGDADAELGAPGHHRDGAQDRKGIPAFRVFARPDGVDARRVGRVRDLQRTPWSLSPAVPCPRVMTEIKREAHARTPRSWCHPEVALSFCPVVEAHPAATLVALPDHDTGTPV